MTSTHTHTEGGMGFHPVEMGKRLIVLLHGRDPVFDGILLINPGSHQSISRLVNLSITIENGRTCCTAIGFRRAVSRGVAVSPSVPFSLEEKATVVSILIPLPPAIPYSPALCITFG